MKRDHIILICLFCVSWVVCRIYHVTHTRSTTDQAYLDASYAAEDLHKDLQIAEDEVHQRELARHPNGY